LDDALLSPAQLAVDLIRQLRESDEPIHFNEEQLLVIALIIWQLEQAWQ
jgi:hypothetical protein